MTIFERRRGRLAFVAAIVLVAGFVAVVQIQRQDQAGPPPGPDDPPAGVSLIYARNRGVPHSLIAYDWSGHRRGSIRLPSWVDLSKVRMAPDGSGFLVDPQTPDDYAGYFDRLGNTLFEAREPAFVSQTWASDSRHVCIVETSGVNVLLRVLKPGGADHTATTSLYGQATVLACNLATDRAVLIANQSEVDVVNPVRGTLISSIPLADLSVVASRDGAYFAAGPADVGAVIYKVAASPVSSAQLEPNYGPVAFSADDSTLLVRNDFLNPPAMAVVAWKTGKVVWRQAFASADTGPALTAPAGGDIALALNTGDVLVIHRDGRTTTLSGLVPVGW